jgi:hypothetical protein
MHSSHGTCVCAAVRDLIAVCTFLNIETACYSSSSSKWATGCIGRCAGGTGFTVAYNLWCALVGASGQAGESCKAISCTAGARPVGGGDSGAGGTAWSAYASPCTYAVDWWGSKSVYGIWDKLRLCYVQYNDLIHRLIKLSGRLFGVAFRY